MDVYDSSDYLDLLPRRWRRRITAGLAVILVVAFQVAPDGTGRFLASQAHEHAIHSFGWVVERIQDAFTIHPTSPTSTTPRNP